MGYDLLSVLDDAKTSKSVEYGYLTAALLLLPAREADGVHNLCGGSTPECRLACVNWTGHRMNPAVQEAARRRTLDYIEDFRAFCQRLEWDIRRLIRHAEGRGLTPCLRLSALCDQPKLSQEMARRFPSLPFYDYTKLKHPWQRTMHNYHLTFSFSGTNFQECENAMLHNINVAVVFRGALPRRWRGYRVIDGDKNDLRFTDPVGVVVGLHEKTLPHARRLEPGGFIQIGR